MNESLLFRIVCVALAGAVSRWGVSRFSNMALGANWPYGTLVVNLIGCFLFGLVFESYRDRVAEDSHLRLLLLTGFAGAFTTYSTFAFDTYELAVYRHIVLAALNVGLHIVLGLAAVVLGISVGRFF